MIENHVIIIPGLGNEIKKHEWAAKRWKRFGLIPHVFDAKWTIEEPNFVDKMRRALKLVDTLAKPTVRISLVGNSAGSSFALNIFCNKKQIIDSVIINCGRVRTGDWPWFTFDQATSSSPSFKQSVLMAEKAEKSLSTNDRKRILTIRPIFDEVVPPTTVPIEGAKNCIVPSVEHVVSITLNMTLFDRKIIDFILQTH
jgi:hypothetical protein